WGHASGGQVGGTERGRAREGWGRIDTGLGRERRVGRKAKYDGKNNSKRIDNDHQQQTTATITTTNHKSTKKITANSGHVKHGATNQQRTGQLRLAPKTCTT
ncbi:unnamed protein product, partial [Ectocarpus sp. 12 AP-2014]